MSSKRIGEGQASKKAKARWQRKQAKNKKRG